MPGVATPGGEVTWFSTMNFLTPSMGPLNVHPGQPTTYPTSCPPELALTCSMYEHTNHCAAWEWNNGAPKQRWERQYDQQVEPVAFGVAGDGSAPSPLVHLSQPKGHKSNNTGIMNLADGTITTLFNETTPGVEANYIPARDGWVRIPNKSDTAETYSLQGGAYWVV